LLETLEVLDDRGLVLEGRAVLGKGVPENVGMDLLKQMALLVLMGIMDLLEIMVLPLDTVRLPIY
jgi:hypothetical protein